MSIRIDVEEIKTVNISISVEYAKWLKGYLQNNITEGEELDEYYEIREDIFTALNNANID
jgi:hypothetical protein